MKPWLYLGNFSRQEHVEPHQDVADIVKKKTKQSSSSLESKTVAAIAHLHGLLCSGLCVCHLNCVTHCVQFGDVFGFVQKLNVVDIVTDISKLSKSITCDWFSCSVHLREAKENTQSQSSLPT